MEHKKLTFEEMPQAMALLLEQVYELNNKLSSQSTSTEDRKKPMGIQEAADYIHVSKKTMYNMVSEKRVPHYKQGTLYFFKDELDEWIKYGRVQTIDELKVEAINGVALRIK